MINKIKIHWEVNKNETINSKELSQVNGFLFNHLSFPFPQQC